MPFSLKAFLWLSVIGLTLRYMLFFWDHYPTNDMPWITYTAQTSNIVAITNKTTDCSECRALYWDHYSQLFAGAYWFHNSTATSFSSPHGLVLIPSSASGYCFYSYSALILQKKPKLSQFIRHSRNTLNIRNKVFQLPYFDDIQTNIYLDGLSLLNFTTTNTPRLAQLSVMECSHELDFATSQLNQKAINDMLLVLTTRNNINRTIKFIQALVMVHEQFDIIVIDDFSSDQTVQYLRKKGYAVIAKKTFRGLADSWNLGFQFARLKGYKYILYSNNDALIPPGAILMMKMGLAVKGVSVVVPLTGSSCNVECQNSSQSFINAHESHLEWLTELSKQHQRQSHMQYPPYNDFVNDLDNSEIIQMMLTKKYKDAEKTFNINSSSSPSDRNGDETTLLLPASSWNSTINIKSFLFGVNVQQVHAATFSRYQLFKPEDGSTTSEDNLLKCLRALQLPPPRICLFAFVYHDCNYFQKNKTHKTKKISRLVDASENESNSGPAAASISHITIAFAISNPLLSPHAGDIFTAQELALQLQETFRVQVKMLHRGINWYKLEAVDVLITMLDAYDISLIVHESIHLIKIAWVRNWFHRWMSRPWLGNYDLLLVSSGVAKSFFDKTVNAQGGFLVQCHARCPPIFAYACTSFCSKHPLPVEILRIATNTQKFSPLSFQPSQITSPSQSNVRQNNDSIVDYIFTGNFWNHSRDIMHYLQPRANALAPYSGWVVGSGWENAVHEQGDWGRLPAGFSDLFRKPVPYQRLPSLYSRAKVVIDDSNHVTKVWGSVNSRVFDALAVGVLVITNGVAGSDDTFQSRLPTYKTNPTGNPNRSDLVSVLSYYLKHSAQRQSLAAELQAEVRNKHTYRARAGELVEYINKIILARNSNTLN